jgi:hypothetical protein
VIIARRSSASMANSTWHGMTRALSARSFDFMFGEELLRLFAVIALELDHPFFSIHEIGATGSARLLESPHQLFEKEFVFWKTVENSHGLALAPCRIETDFDHEVARLDQIGKAIGIHLDVICRLIEAEKKESRSSTSLKVDAP